MEINLQINGSINMISIPWLNKIPAVWSTPHVLYKKKKQLISYM